MKRLSKSGEELVTRVEMKVFLPDGTTKKVVARAKPKHGYGSEHIENILHDMAEKLDKAYPLIEFRLVPIGKAAFNFICNGEKQWVKIPELVPQKTGSATLSARAS